MREVRSRRRTGSRWVTPGGSPWATIDIQHPGCGDVFGNPAQHGRATRVERRRPLAPPRRVGRLGEHPRHRVPVTPDERSDTGVELSLLLQELDRAACHGCKHPPSLREWH